MSVNGVTNVTRTYDSKGVDKTKEYKSKSTELSNGEVLDDTAVIYEKSEEEPVAKPVYKRDTATVERLLEEAEKRHQGLRDLVEKMLLKQGETFTDATDMYALLREGKLEVDPEVSQQAQKDIAEDGYWGVEQTSERLFSFAKALSGGDPDKADLMMDAVLKGFDEATKAWGGELPEISQKTLDATIEKMESWRDSVQK